MCLYAVCLFLSVCMQTWDMVRPMIRQDDHFSRVTEVGLDRFRFRDIDVEM